MAKNELVSLALLSIAPMHPYAISAIVEEMGMEHWAQISRASLYAALGRLEKRGAVAVQTEKVDNMPERKVYSITAEGKAMFHDELRQAITTVCKSEPTLFHLGVNFLFGAEANEAIGWAKQRQREIESGVAEIREKYEMICEHQIESAQITLRAALNHATTELNATRELIALLERSPEYYSNELAQWREHLQHDPRTK